jgi:hypothetical protein
VITTDQLKSKSSANHLYSGIRVPRSGGDFQQRSRRHCIDVGNNGNRVEDATIYRSRRFGSLVVERRGKLLVSRFIPGKVELMPGITGIRCLGRWDDDSYTGITATSVI